MIKNKYKLARIVDGLLLSANNYRDKPLGDCCLEYKVGEITKVKGIGIACYKRKADALQPDHISETRGYFNHGNLIVLLKLRPIGKPVWTHADYKKGCVYEGGVNYRSVEVLEATIVP